MRIGAIPLKMNGTEPCVIQGDIYGHDVTWNPDDMRFYVSRNGETVATFADWRNTTYYCKTHN